MKDKQNNYRGVAPQVGTALQRTFRVEADSLKNDVIEFSASSDKPYLRSFGYEILSHDKSAVDLTRLNEGAAVLVDHSGDQVGVVEEAWLDGHKMRVKVRFSKYGKGAEVEGDIRDGIRRNVSIGYSILAVERGKDTKDGVPSFTVTSWQPYEVSIVAIPADITVGVGRGSKMTQSQLDTLKSLVESAEVISEEVSEEITVETDSETKSQEVSEPVVEVVEVSAPEGTEDKSIEITTETTPSPLVIAEESPSTDSQEVSESDTKDLDLVATENKAVEAATTQEAINGPTIIVKEEKSHMKDNLESPISNPLGMSDKELKQYSIRNAILTAINGTRSGLEFEVSQELSKRQGETQGIYIPYAVRNISIGDSATGGAFTFAQGGDFIDFLRNASVVAKAGASVLNLPYKLSLPRQTTDYTAGWIAEDGSGATISSASYDQVTVSPKKLLTYTGVSKETLAVASYDVEAQIRGALYKSMMTAFDKAAIQGASNGPTGLLSSSLLPSSSTYASGAAFAYSIFTGAERVLGENNGGSDNLAWVTTPGVYTTAKGTAKYSNGPAIVAMDGTVDGVPVYRTMNVPTLLGHFAILGSWESCLMATFGNGFEVVVDPYTSKHKGIVEVAATILGDVQFKNVKNFAITKNINA